MPAIIITINVSAAEAVRAGRSVAGPVRLELTAETIANLSPEHRDALVAHLGDSSPRDPSRVRWGDPLTMHAPPVGTADLETLFRLLDHRRHAIALQAAAELAEAPAVQQRIVSAIRAADPDQVAELARGIVADGPSAAEAAILASTRHPAIRDALAQVQLVDAFLGGGSR